MDEKFWSFDKLLPISLPLSICIIHVIILSYRDILEACWRDLHGLNLVRSQQKMNS